ncbi:hypothetical protein KSP39_PZI018190 [Platanthera zijinensis]|uniref:Uncharacterized protein n=1 Tax=Platanthera zijinensis TaxID=2320716 RepID=A0AAP0B493_9ASPA
METFNTSGLGGYRPVMRSQIGTSSQPTAKKCKKHFRCGKKRLRNVKESNTEEGQRVVDEERKFKKDCKRKKVPQLIKESNIEEVQRVLDDEKVDEIHLVDKDCTRGMKKGRPTVAGKTSGGRSEVAVDVGAGIGEVAGKHGSAAGGEEDRDSGIVQPEEEEILQGRQSQLGERFAGLLDGGRGSTPSGLLDKDSLERVVTQRASKSRPSKERPGEGSVGILYANYWQKRGSVGVGPGERRARRPLGEAPRAAPELDEEEKARRRGVGLQEGRAALDKIRRNQKIGSSVQFQSVFTRREGFFYNPIVKVMKLLMTDLIKRIAFFKERRGEINCGEVQRDKLHYTGEVQRALDPAFSVELEAERERASNGVQEGRSRSSTSSCQQCCKKFEQRN